MISLAATTVTDMSLGVVTFQLIERTERHVTYSVASPDFSSTPGAEEVIGTLIIRPGENSCTFHPEGALAGKDVLSPDLFLRHSPEEISRRRREGDLAAKAAGPWMRRIGVHVKHMLMSGDFPPKYP